MIKITVTTLLGLLVIILGSIYLFGGDDSQSANTETLPWVEVLKSGVFDATRQLKTGDELRPPATIKTNGAGLANVYFPDGSVTRLDSNTELVLEQGSYDNADKTLRVKILLSVGRVWSKILALATPRSLWEVSTANAVVTVRGTAFGVEYIGNKTTVVGSERVVAVTSLDRKTVVTVLENQVVTIADGLVKVRAKKALEEEWVGRFESADKALESKAIPPAIKPAIDSRQPKIQTNTVIAPTNATVAPATEPVLEKIQPTIQFIDDALAPDTGASTETFTQPAAVPQPAAKSETNSIFDIR